MGSTAPERILYVLPSLAICGGIEVYAMNYFRHIDRSRYVIDFITHEEGAPSFKAEIEQLGGRVYVLPQFSMRALPEIRVAIRAFFAEHNEYKIIHCHMANAAPFYFAEAKKAGINIRILHSHQNRAADTLSHALRNMPLLWLGRVMATEYVACTRIAGDFLFGRKPYKIIRNAIDSRRFTFNEDRRAELRYERDIPEDAIVVGHVGRLCPQKNQLFLLDVFAQMRLLSPNVKLLLVGEGVQESEIMIKAAKLGIMEDVIFYGVAKDAADVYQMMDVFCLPSLYEGLGIVAVEAQANGLPCLMSNGVPKDAAILPTAQYMGLAESPMDWAKRLLSLGNAPRTPEAASLVAIENKGYDIKSNAKGFERYYDSLLGKEEEDE